METNNGITFTLDEINEEFSESTDTSLDLKIDDLNIEVADKDEEVKLPEEVKKPEEVVEEDLEIPKTKTPQNLVNLAQELLGVETIVVEGENGEDIELSLEDANLTLEDISELAKTKKNQELDDFKLNSVSVKNLNDNQKAIIDIVAKGGDIGDLLQLQQTYVDPISKLDLESERDQVEAIYLHGKASRKTDEEIEFMIEGIKSKGMLKEKAEAAINDLNEAVNAQTLLKQKEAQERIADTEKKLKEFKKDLKNNLKEEFKEFNEATTNRLTEFASKRKEDGKYDIDIAYMKMRSDAKLATKLALFLYDMEEYNKVITKDAPLREAKKTEQKLRLGRFSTGSSAGKTKFEENRNDLMIDI